MIGTKLQIIDAEVFKTFTFRYMRKKAHDLDLEEMPKKLLKRYVSFYLVYLYMTDICGSKVSNIMNQLMPFFMH